MKLVKYLNFPVIPEHLRNLAINEISKGPDPRTVRPSENYKWTIVKDNELEQWLITNISSDLFWGLQVIIGDLPVHVDNPTTVKICYLFDCGGDNVITEFHRDNQVIDSINIDQDRWHILNVMVEHSVRGVESDKTRISLTGRIFEKL